MSRPATSRLKVNPPLGAMPVLQFCTLDQLAIDPTYQRTLDASASQTLIRRIAMFWNWDLCQPLVVARRAEGALFVVDGQHRLAAARMRPDILQLPCVVTGYRSPADEAAAFVALNQQRRPLNALDLFKAALAAEDEQSLDVMRAIIDAGLRLAPHSNYSAWKPGMVSNIGGILNAYRAHGAGVTRTALSIMAKAFEGQVLRYCGTLFGGIVGVINMEITGTGLEEWLQDTSFEPLLTDVIAGTSQAEWMADIRTEKGKTGEKWAPCATAVMLRAWSEALDGFFEEDFREPEAA